VNELNFDKLVESVVERESLEKLIDLVKSSSDFEFDVFIQGDNKDIFWLGNDDPEFFKGILMLSLEEFLDNLRKNDRDKIEEYGSSIFDRKFLYMQNAADNVSDISEIIMRVEGGRYTKSYSTKDLEKISKLRLILKIFKSGWERYMLGIQYLTPSKIFKNKRILALSAGKLSMIKDKFLIDPKDFFDYIVVGDVVLIRSLFCFERDFGFYKKYKDAKDKTIEEIKKNDNLFGKDIKIVGVDNFNESIKDKTLYLKRFYSVINKGNYKKFEFDRVKRMIEDFDLKIKFDEESKSIDLSGASSVRDFLKLYDELYYKSTLSGNKMVASETENL
jgi:hypothetical protein